MDSSLYIVATPIGNLDDITLRALNILKAVDVIACEDTRQTVKLLRHYAITEKQLFAYHNFNERSATEKLLTLLAEGKSIALVSDAGTPALSDPGFFLVRAAFERGVKVVPVAGISALTAAISVCPIPIRYFHFEGFLPQKKGRQTRLKLISTLDSPIVLYESPHRILKLLDELIQYFDNPTIMIGRELTKIYEEIVVGVASELKVKFSSKKILGEFVIIVSKSTSNRRTDTDVESDSDENNENPEVTVEENTPDDRY